jgi:hypothetical protein
MSTSTTTAPVGTGVARTAEVAGEWLPRIALGGMGGFALAAVVSSFLQPDSYDSVRDTISVLAAKDATAPAVMMTGFTLMAIGVIAGAIGLWRALPFVSARIAAVLLVVSGTATGVAGFARIECNPAVAGCLARLETSQSTTIHGRAALLTFAPLILAGLFLAWSTLRLSGPWARPVRIGAIALAVVSVVLVFAVEEASTDVQGLLQRVFALTGNGLPLALLWLRTRRLI